LSSAVARAVTTPKINLVIDGVHQAADGSISFSVHAGGSQSSLVAVIAENATVSEVLRGENQGRTLHHVAVARVLKEFGNKATDGRPLVLSGANLAAAEKSGVPLRLVVFLVNHKNSHVVGVAEQILDPSRPSAVEQTTR
jgi:hypothetical protein